MNKRTNVELIKKNRHKPKKQKVNQIRKNYLKEASFHPNYVYEIRGNTAITIGLTHARITDGVRNIPLIKNPNPKDNRKSYARPFSNKVPMDKLSKKPYKNYKVQRKDKKRLKRI